MLSGTDAATPILFALFTALTGQNTHRWFTKAKATENTTSNVPLSGAPVSSHCPVHKEECVYPGYLVCSDLYNS